MPRLIPPELGNGRRPGDPLHETTTSPTAVPILDVSEDTHELVGAMHAAALDPDDDTQLLTGAVVMFGNPRPVDSDNADTSTIHVGASTLHEAATECVTCIVQLARDMPDWIACTDEQLGAVVAEHFTIKGYSTCKQIDMSKVPA